MEHDETGRRSVLSARRMRIPTRGWVGGLLVVLALVVGIGWSVSSPLASSPDDDYHLGSIWCPRPVGQSCETSVVDGAPVVKVPRAVADSSMRCFAFKTNSAGCAMGYRDDDLVWSTRYDDGNYPTGFYRVHHLLIGQDVQTSALLMRGLNVALCVGLVTALLLLARPVQRHRLGLALLITWSPIGVYFISSNNPSSWAITGVLVYATGMYLATTSEGRRRAGLIACAVAGALMSLASRYDASFYLFVVGVALLVAVRWRRALWPEMVLTAVLGFLGVRAMVVSGHTDAIPGVGSTGPEGGFLHRLIVGIETAPKYVGGFWGLGWAPGWGDVPLWARAPYILAILAAGGVILLAVTSGSWRKWLGVGVMLGAIVGLPAVFYAAGVFRELEAYQARYVLPLFAPLLFLLLTVDEDEPLRLTRAQTTWLGLSVVGCHVLSHHTVLMRFVVGVTPDWVLNLDAAPQWWWDVPVTPMTVWAVTSCAFLALTVAVLRSVEDRCACRREEDV